MVLHQNALDNVKPLYWRISLKCVKLILTLKQRIGCLESLLVSLSRALNTDEFSVSGVDTRGSGEPANSVTDTSMSSRCTKTTFVGRILFPSGRAALTCGVFLVSKECWSSLNDLLKTECWSTNEKWKVPFSTQHNYFVAYCKLAKARFSFLDVKARSCCIIIFCVFSGNSFKSPFSWVGGYREGREKGMIFLCGIAFKGLSNETSIKGNKHWIQYLQWPDPFKRNSLSLRKQYKQS